MSKIDRQIAGTPLFKLLEKLAYRHGSYSSCFSDFLEYVVGCFVTTGNPELAERFKKVYEKDYPIFDQMLRALLQSYQDHLPKEDNPITSIGGFKQKVGWYDPLGALYEEITSSHKSSGMGQFFSPPQICDVMAAITISEETPPGKYVHEPCSGSGRMVLAANSIRPGLIYNCVDLDPMCANMTAINMLFHGMQGQVCCADALWPEHDWRFGYQVNAHLYSHRVPTLLRLEKEDSWIVQYAATRASEVVEEKRCKVLEDNGLKFPEQDLETGAKQLSLF